MRQIFQGKKITTLASSLVRCVFDLSPPAMQFSNFSTYEKGVRSLTSVEEPLSAARTMKTTLSAVSPQPACGNAKLGVSSHSESKFSPEMLTHLAEKESHKCYLTKAAFIPRREGLHGQIMKISWSRSSTLTLIKAGSLPKLPLPRSCGTRTLCLRSPGVPVPTSGLLRNSTESFALALG